MNQMEDEFVRHKQYMKNLKRIRKPLKDKIGSLPPLDFNNKGGATSRK